MSVVSGVTILCSLVESPDEDGAALLSTLNTWLAGQGGTASWSRFKEISDQAGGTKHPQHFIFAAGINCFHEDEFAAFVMGLPWQEPDNVVLVIQPEEGPTRIWRAGFVPITESNSADKQDSSTQTKPK